MMGAATVTLSAFLGITIGGIPLWLAIEHATLFFLVLALVYLAARGRWSRKSTGHAFAGLTRDYVQALEQIKALAGPGGVLSWPDVYAAPAASMDVSNLHDGELITHRDGRGAIYKFKLADGVFVNMYFTKAGYRRSGDIHDCNQYDVVLQGRTRLRLIDPHTGREVVQEYGPNDFLVIPARTPHMFEFLEDNCLLEWWDDTFAAWYYKPYRSVIERSAPLAETEGADFSTKLPAAASKGGKAA